MDQPIELGWLRNVLVNSVAAAHLVPNRIRLLIVRSCGVPVSLRSVLSAGIIIRSSRLSIGPGSTVNYRCVFDNRLPVRIGQRVGVGIGVTFVTSSHRMDDPHCRAGIGDLAPIVVGDGAWIGSGATVLPGVSIGTGAVIAAGAVVNRDVPAHWLYGGVPAKPIRELKAESPGRSVTIID